jgi:hypothetical protein
MSDPARGEKWSIRHPDLATDTGKGTPLKLTWTLNGRLQSKCRAFCRRVQHSNSSDLAGISQAVKTWLQNAQAPAGARGLGMQHSELAEMLKVCWGRGDDLLEARGMMNDLGAMNRAGRWGAKRWKFWALRDFDDPSGRG